MALMSLLVAPGAVPSIRGVTDAAATAAEPIVPTMIPAFAHRRLVGLPPSGAGCARAPSPHGPASGAGAKGGGIVTSLTLDASTDSAGSGASGVVLAARLPDERDGPFVRAGHLSGCRSPTPLPSRVVNDEG